MYNRFGNHLMGHYSEFCNNNCLVKTVEKDEAGSWWSDDIYQKKKDLIIFTEYYLIIDVPVAVWHQLINMDLGQILI